MTTSSSLQQVMMAPDGYPMPCQHHLNIQNADVKLTMVNLMMDQILMELIGQEELADFQWRLFTLNWELITDGHLDLQFLDHIQQDKTVVISVMQMMMTPNGYLGSDLELELQLSVDVKLLQVPQNLDLVVLEQEALLGAEAVVRTSMYLIQVSVEERREVQQPHGMK